MLTNVVQGGELYDYLHREGNIRELGAEHARFYTANIFLALSHLHEHGFVYRDMKPENGTCTEMDDEVLVLTCIMIDSHA